MELFVVFLSILSLESVVVFMAICVECVYRVKCFRASAFVVCRDFICFCGIKLVFISVVCKYVMIVFYVLILYLWVGWYVVFCIFLMVFGKLVLSVLKYFFVLVFFSVLFVFVDLNVCCWVCEYIFKIVIFVCVFKLVGGIKILIGRSFVSVVRK